VTRRETEHRPGTPKRQRTQIFVGESKRQLALHARRIIRCAQKLASQMQLIDRGLLRPGWERSQATIPAHERTRINPLQLPSCVVEVPSRCAGELPGAVDLDERVNPGTHFMSQHRSLRAVSTIGAKRNVMKRFERVALLKKRGEWKDGDRVTGLRKTKPEV
jgi:small basic protein (TIGR04137 family)